MVDVDKFKSLNDSFGHLLGDEVCGRFPRYCRDRFEDRRGLPVRVGRIRDPAPADRAGTGFHVAEKLRHAVEVGVSWGSRVLTISGGVAVYPYTVIRRDELVKTADAALYAAKEAGRNQILSAGPLSPLERGARSYPVPN